MSGAESRVGVGVGVAAIHIAADKSEIGRSARSKSRGLMEARTFYLGIRFVQPHSLQLHSFVICWLPVCWVTGALWVWILAGSESTSEYTKSNPPLLFFRRDFSRQCCDTNLKLNLVTMESGKMTKVRCEN